MVYIDDEITELKECIHDRNGEIAQLKDRIAALEAALDSVLGHIPHGEGGEDCIICSGVRPLDSQRFEHENWCPIPDARSVLRGEGKNEP